MRQDTGGHRYGKARLSQGTAVVGFSLLLSLNTISLINHTSFIPSALGAAAALAALVPLGRMQWTTRPIPRATLVVYTTTMVLLLVAQLGRFGSPLCQHVWAALLGAGIALGSAWWFKLYASMAFSQAVGSVLLSFGLSSVLRLALFLLASFCLPATALALTAALGTSAFLFHRLERAPHGAAVLDTASREWPPSSLPSVASLFQRQGRPSTVFIELGAYGLVYGLLRIGTADTPEAWTRIAGLCTQVGLPILLYLWFAAQSKTPTKPNSSRTAFIGVSIAVLAAVLLSGHTREMLAVVTLALRGVISVLIYIRLLSMARATRISPLKIFGLGKAIYQGCLAVGAGIYQLSMVQTAMESLPTNVTLFLVSCIVLILLSSILGTTPPPATEPQPEAPSMPTFEEGCAALAAAHGLTAREADVMELIAGGSSKKETAKQLGIAEDTVRHHARNIYAKLGVHTKQELLMLIVGTKDPS